MKTRKYKAIQLDPRATVITQTDYDKAIKNIKNEAIRAYNALYRIGRLSSGMQDFLIKRMNEL